MRPSGVPTVVERSASGEQAFDIYSRLLRERVVFLSSELHDELANLVIAQLLFLEAKDPDRDVSLYVNSPGGDVTALFAIYDTMQAIKPDVSTLCIGQAAPGAPHRPDDRADPRGPRPRLHPRSGGSEGVRCDRSRGLIAGRSPLDRRHRSRLRSAHVARRPGGGRGRYRYRRADVRDRGDPR